MTTACILGVAGPQLDPEARRFYREADPWGFILFARNIEDPDQVRSLTSALRECVGRDAPILVDQEGGRVQRLGPPHWRRWVPPLEEVAGTPNSERVLWIRARLMADELRAVGIDVNCAPTCDVARDETHPFLRNRCHGLSPDEVIRNARAVADGLLAGGVLPVMKHMPGHGRGQADSHRDLPVITATEAALEDDFAPFHALRDLPMGMTAHVVLSALSDRPATQDPEIVALIRERIGFDGLLMTDDISMEALSGDIAERGARSIKAGCDIVLHCNGVRSEMEDCLSSCGRLEGQSEERAAAALAMRPTPDPATIAELEAEFVALTARGDG
ncbi:glycoside hydrolase family 3 N-terminal domain-containing protein [Palleronia sp. LCG004]|uniref:glycoside hydrolase family 3 N-terminal domain-containing protein n=1 Tax=Palleronia sp. LCG004 TaxID=3079304 RepID=UPI002942F78E|nr:glycoside hydrolase family 3 N-terminal domain-containing protein [Palleronia sp. LCG004]WOI57155.1 glycoside hydrolase family 3 N-terminal domain-containing protein [Palleronia sp. LCG004]